MAEPTINSLQAIFTVKPFLKGIKQFSDQSNTKPMEIAVPQGNTQEIYTVYIQLMHFYLLTGSHCV